MINRLNKKAQAMPIDYIAGVIIILGGLAYFVGQSSWGAVMVALGVFIELLAKKLIEVIR
jgi:hypothetical protein